MIWDRTLPVGAVPARLLRSGEYSIRGMVDLIAGGSLSWYADAAENDSRIQIMSASCRSKSAGGCSLGLDALHDGG